MQIINCNNFTRLLRLTSIDGNPDSQFYTPESGRMDSDSDGVVVYYFNPHWNQDNPCREILSEDGDKQGNSTSTILDKSSNLADREWSASDVAFLLSNDIFLGVMLGLIIYLEALIVFGWGRPLISRSGHIKLFSGDILGPENSQHLSDWYTFTHILHGFILYALGQLVAHFFPVLDIGVRGFYIIALLLEAFWESIENSPFGIERHRRTAVDGYYGDSVINSVSDMLAMSFGYWLAHLLPPLIVIGLAVADELFLLLAIRDSLTVKVIQIIHPSNELAKWQANAPLVLDANIETFKDMRF